MKDTAELTGAGQTDRRTISARDRWIVQGCRRSLRARLEQAQQEWNWGTSHLDQVMGVKA